MLMRSTGLGPTELVAEFTGLERRGDYLILEMKTLAPVRWKIRGGVCFQDFLMLMRLLLRSFIWGFFLNPRNWFKQAQHPGEF
jgi:hypothetical protein